MVGADQPLLEVANRPIGKGYSGLRAFAQLRPEGWVASDMFKAGLRQTGETLEAVRIDGGTGCDVLGEEHHYRGGLEVGDHAHADSTGSLATLFHRHQDESRPPFLELSASPQSGLLAPNPRVILWFAKIRSSRTILTFQQLGRNNRATCSAFLLGLFRLIWLFGRGHHAVVLENLALRQQLAIYKRKTKRPRLVGRDRMVLDRAVRGVEGLADDLVRGAPRHGGALAAGAFPQILGALSKQAGEGGAAFDRPSVRKLIRTMARANPLWRAPRIHGELHKLGIEVSERTVSRILRTVKRPPSQTWKTFLQNHTRGDRRD